MKTILLAVEGVAIQAAAGTLGKIPTIQIVAYAGGTMTPPGFPELAIDTSGADVSGDIPILTGHAEDLDGIAGQGRAEVLGGQILVAGQLTEASAGGRLAIGLGRSGVKVQASVGYQPLESEYVPAGHSVQLNGRTLTAGQNGLRIIRRGKLREVSLVAVGADSQSNVLISAKGTRTMADEATTNVDYTKPEHFADEMRAAWNRDGLTDSERVLARWNGTTFSSAGIRQQTERFLHAALGGKLTYADFERELLKAQVNDLTVARLNAERPMPPPVYSSGRDLAGDVLRCAFDRTVGLRDVEKQYDPRVLEASDHFRGIGVQELLLRAARANGYDGGREKVTSGNLREVLQYAMPAGRIRASMVSTIDVAGILSNTANKILGEGFNSVEQTYRAISRPRNVSDFKLTTVYRLTASCEYEELPPSGEIKSGTLGEESYDVQAKTYAKLIGLSRTSIINDDLSAFNDVRVKLGRGAGLALNKIFWTAFLNNATFFTVARGNLLTGAGGALLVDGVALDSVNQLFAAIVDADGGPTGIAPRLLLSPPVLGATARQLYSSAEIRDTTGSTKYPTTNIWQNRFKPLESAYLANATIPGGSATGWYLLNDPQETGLAVIDIAYLDNQQSPTIESSDADFDTLGIVFRGYHDFGVSLSEWRCGVKATGTT